MNVRPPCFHYCINAVGSHPTEEPISTKAAIASEPTREEETSATFSYGGNFVKRKSFGLLKGHRSGSSIWF